LELVENMEHGPARDRICVRESLMDADLEEKTGRQIAVVTFAIAPGYILEWLNNFETETSTAVPSELRDSLILETEYFAYFYLQKRFANYLDAEANGRVFSRAIDMLAFFLSSCYFQVGDGAEKLEAKLKVTLRDILKERANFYAVPRRTFFERITGRTPSIANTFATLVQHWVFSKMNLNKRVAESFAQDMVNRIYSLHPQEMIREAENSL
jgi:hypothetical protein